MFEGIIGYQAEKDELAMFCDIIKNPEYYKSFNAEIPKGIILHGLPGVGKTTFANAIIQASGRPFFTIRKNAETGEFIKHMVDIYEQAKNAAPSIVLLDDMDKYGNGELFSQEYTSLQGILDDFHPYDIFSIGTANELYKLPKSLIRPGRFDRVIKIDLPNKLESGQITTHYLSNKNIDPSVNMSVVAKLLNGESCATLESVINIAAMNAAYERSDTIKTNHIVEAILTSIYDMPKIDSTRTPYETYFTAIHEAGHTVVSDFVMPDEEAFATIRPLKYGIPFERVYDKDPNNCDPSRFAKEACVLLAGKAAIELKFGCPDPLSSWELRDAAETVRKGFSDNATNGLKSIRTGGSYIPTSEEFDDMPMDISKTPKDVTEYLEQLYAYDIQILTRDWNYVETIANALVQKETILLDEIQALKLNRPRMDGLFNNLITPSR